VKFSPVFSQLKVDFLVEMDSSKYEPKEHDYTFQGVTHQGFVRDLITRKPIKNAIVHVWRSGDRLPLNAPREEIIEVDESGYFSVDNCLLGSTNIRIWSKKHQKFTYKGGISASEPVHILMKQGKPHGKKPKFRPPPAPHSGPRLWGSALVVGGTPAVPFEILIAEINGSPIKDEVEVKTYIHGLPGLRSRWHARIMSGHGIEIPALRPGTYLVTVWAKGYKPETASLHYPFSDVKRYASSKRRIFIEKLESIENDNNE